MPSTTTTQPSYPYAAILYILVVDFLIIAIFLLALALVNCFEPEQYVDIEAATIELEEMTPMYRNSDVGSVEALPLYAEVDGNGSSAYKADVDVEDGLGFYGRGR